MNEILLFDYFRSSASFRVRIALNLKQLDYTAVPTSLLAGDNRSDEYLARNPQGLVPMMSIDGHDLTQSLAIIDYLDGKYPVPKLIADDPLARAKIMAQAMAIAVDIHPLNNLRVLKYLKSELGLDQDGVDNWYRHWILEGFVAVEAMAPEKGIFGGDAPNLVDVCLVPQMFNARRFDTPLDAFPNLVRIDGELTKLDAFKMAHPDAVDPDNHARKG